MEQKPKRKYTIIKDANGKRVTRKEFDRMLLEDPAFENFRKTLASLMFNAATRMAEQARAELGENYSKEALNKWIREDRRKTKEKWDKYFEKHLGGKKNGKKQRNTGNKTKKRQERKED